MKEKELNRLRRRAWLRSHKWQLTYTIELGNSTRVMETPWQMIEDFNQLSSELKTVSPLFAWVIDQLMV